MEGGGPMMLPMQVNPNGQPSMNPALMSPQQIQHLLQIQQQQQQQQQTNGCRNV